MTHLTLVRHGQTDWNLARRIQGSTDIPLNATGREDAARAAEQLATSTHHAVYTSPLLRARETAEIIADRLGLEVAGVVPDIREREFGEGEGMLVEDYIGAYGDWHAEVAGAETLQQVGERAIAALHAIARQARRRSAPERNPSSWSRTEALSAQSSTMSPGARSLERATCCATDRFIASWRPRAICGCSRSHPSADTSGRRTSPLC
ncbi:histidine phosphatase family protein [Microbacterium sp. Se63.02b]|uniref:histidine phosphatase family protein n=1 Tax=Microbacterium sp. Se63.02b TaxID=2709304 RepID=UPI0031F70AC3